MELLANIYVVSASWFLFIGLSCCGCTSIAEFYGMVHLRTNVDHTKNKVYVVYILWQRKL